MPPRATIIPKRETRARRQRRLGLDIPPPPSGSWRTATPKHIEKSIRIINRAVHSGFCELDDKAQKVPVDAHNYVQVHRREVGGLDRADLLRQDQEWRRKNSFIQVNHISYVDDFIDEAKTAVGGGAGHPPVGNGQVAQREIYIGYIAFYNSNNGHRYSYAVARHRFRPSDRILLVYCAACPEKSTKTVTRIRNGKFGPVRRVLMDRLIQEFNITHVYFSAKQWPEIPQPGNNCGRNTLHFLYLLREYGQKGFDENAEWVRKMGLKELRWNLRVRQDRNLGR